MIHPSPPPASSRRREGESEVSLAGPGVRFSYILLYTRKRTPELCEKQPTYVPVSGVWNAAFGMGFKEKRELGRTSEQDAKEK